MRYPVLEAERVKHQLNKGELATLLGVSQRTVRNWQNGTTELPVSKLILLAKTWNCSTDYLLGLQHSK